MKKSGNTPCIRLSEWEKDLNFDGVWVKDESANPTGTFKDRRSEAIVNHAKERSADALVLISAGNAAYSLAQYAHEEGIDVRPVVDKNLTPAIRAVLKDVCDGVQEVDLSDRPLLSDDLIDLVRNNADETILDVTNGYHAAYMQIVRELARDVPCSPDAIFVPFGGGEAMVGVMLGVNEVGWKVRTEVYGITNQESERLRTAYLYVPYYEYLHNEADAPQHSVFGIRDVLPEFRDEICNALPPNIRVEDAPRNVFDFVRLVAEEKRNAFGHMQNIVILNSGYGQVLDEADKVAK